MIGINVWSVHLAPLNTPSALILTLVNTVLLYCSIQVNRQAIGVGGKVWGLGTAYRSYLVLHSFLHSSQVNRNVRGVGHQTSIRTKQCAGEVQSLLNKLKQEACCLLRQNTPPLPPCLFLVVCLAMQVTVLLSAYAHLAYAKSGCQKQLHEQTKLGRKLEISGTENLGLTNKQFNFEHGQWFLHWGEQNNIFAWMPIDKLCVEILWYLLKLIRRAKQYFCMIADR